MDSTHIHKPFDRKEYNVTDCCFQLFCCGSQTLTLEVEEVIVHTECMCGCSTENKRLPYADLSSVELQNACGCCYSFLTPAFGPIVPGCGCRQDLVKEIVQELRTRLQSRGATADIQRAEQCLAMLHDLTSRVAGIETKLDLILNSISPAAYGHTMDRK